MALRYFFAYCVFTLCQVTGLPTKYALLGKDVNFVAGIKTASDDIMWRHNGNKVVELNGQMQQQYGSFKGRAILDRHSADLNITNLQYEDSGRYDLKIYINNILKSSQYDLEVIDSVAKPNISCEMNHGGSSGKTGGGATLTCSAESKQSQSLLEFEWSSDGNKQVGPKLIIPLGDVHDKQVYNCTVSNPLTTESATFTAKECYSDKSLSTLGIIGICVASLILILISFVVIYKLCKGKCGRVSKSDVENQSDQDTAADKNEDLEEKQVLLDRAPTMPSHQPLGHLNQKPTHNDSEKKKQDLRTPHLQSMSEKPPQTQDLTSNKAEADGDEHGEAVGQNASVHNPADSVMAKLTAVLEDKRKSIAPPVPEKSELARMFSRRLTAKENGVKPSAPVEGIASEPAASAEADVAPPGCDIQSSEEKRIESSASSSSEKCHDDFPTNEQAAENTSGETWNKDPEPDPVHSKTSYNNSEKKTICSSPSSPSGKSSHTHPTNEADKDDPGQTGEINGSEPDPAHSKTSDTSFEENGAKIAGLEDKSNKRKTKAHHVSEMSEFDILCSGTFIENGDVVKPSTAVEKKASEFEPAAYAEADDTLYACDKQNLDEKRAKRKSISHLEDFIGLTEEEHKEKFSAAESEPAASKTADFSYQNDADEMDILGW